eukprot:6492749-Amphidinium_carterae.6
MQDMSVAASESSVTMTCKVYFEQRGVSRNIGMERIVMVTGMTWSDIVKATVVKHPWSADLCSHVCYNYRQHACERNALKS